MTCPMRQASPRCPVLPVNNAALAPIATPCSRTHRWAHSRKAPMLPPPTKPASLRSPAISLSIAAANPPWCWRHECFGAGARPSSADRHRSLWPEANDLSGIDLWAFGSHIRGRLVALDRAFQPIAKPPRRSGSDEPRYLCPCTARVAVRIAKLRYPDFWGVNRSVLKWCMPHSRDCATLKLVLIIATARLGREVLVAYQ
jgi:hypothetical protein